MTFKIKALIATAVFAASGAAFAQTTLLNGSYDVAREFYKDYNAAFIAHYKKTTGKDVKIDQSHAGSSAVARSVADGLDADVVTMNTRFVLHDETTGKTREMALVYPIDSDPDRGRISVLAPVGGALLGLSVGQAIDWPLPRGKTKRMRLVRVLYQPERAGHVHL